MNEIIGEEVEEDIEKSADKKKNTELEEIKQEIQEMKDEKSSDFELMDGPMYGPTTSVQHNGSSYMTTIPKGIVDSTGLAKKDELKWIKARYKGMKVITIIITEENSFNLPLEERKGGR